MLAGRLSYRVLLPVLRLYLRRTKRAYVLLVSGQSVLLAKNWFGDGKWALPGGGINRGETPKDAVRRETLEELGLELNCSDLDLIDQGRWRTDNLGHRYYIFTSNALSKTFKVDGKEILMAEWVNISSLTPSTTSIEILHVLDKVPRRS